MVKRLKGSEFEGLGFSSLACKGLGFQGESPGGTFI